MTSASHVLPAAALILSACAHAAPRDPAPPSIPRAEPIPPHKRLISGERDPEFPRAYQAKFYNAGRRTPAVLFKLCTDASAVPTEITPAGDRAKPPPFGLDVVYPDEMEPAFRDHYLSRLAAWRFPPQPPDTKPCTVLVFRYRLETP